MSTSRRRFLELSALGLGSLQARLTAQDAVPSIDERIRQQLRDAPLTMRFQGGTADECRKWQAEFAAKLRSLIGPHAPPRQWKTTVEKSTEQEDHRLDELILTAEGVPPLPVAVLVPRGKAEEKRAGVLALHGHGPRGHLAIAQGQSGLHLVRKGFVVATPCFTPFGRRLGKDMYGEQDACGITFLRLQLLGKLLIAENLRDALWTFEHLARHEQVDAARLGCVGLSYGGRMSMLTSALEPRIRVAVISGALNVMQERASGHYSCGAQVVPGLLQFGDVPEIGGLIAPRPAVWEWGTQDKLIDPKWADEALARMRRVYEALGAGDRLQLDRFEGGHIWSWKLALPLLEKVLGK